MMTLEEPMVPARLLDDIRVSMKLLQQQHAAAWAEVDRVSELHREAIETLGAIAGPTPKFATDPLEWIAWAHGLAKERIAS